MTELEEKAAKVDNWNRYKETKSRLASITGELNNIGNTWEVFCPTLQKLSNESVFECSERYISASYRDQPNASVHIERANVDWARLQGLIADFTKTRSQLKALESLVKEHGFNP